MTFDIPFQRQFKIFRGQILARHQKNKVGKSLMGVPKEIHGSMVYICHLKIKININNIKKKKGKENSIENVEASICNRNLLCS